MALKGSSVPDKTGSPLQVSAIMNYRVNDAIAFTYSVADPTHYIENQALEVLRRVCARFPFQSVKEPCLIADSKFIGVCMRELVQDRIKLCGIEVIAMEIMEVAYAPEVAMSLLQVQQAQAKIDAKQLIVEGSVSIVSEALDNLKTKGIEMQTQDTSDLVRKLMVITCSDQGNAQPVLNI